jgi:hypothetical protein
MTTHIYIGYHVFNLETRYGHFEHTFFTAWIYRCYVIYNMDTLNLSFFTLWTH